MKNIRLVFTFAVAGGSEQGTDERNTAEQRDPLFLVAQFLLNQTAEHEDAAIIDDDAGVDSCDYW